MLAHEPWRAHAGLHHGFLDAAACAGALDWEPVVAAAGARMPVRTVRQVHGSRVVTARAWDERPAADAVVTGETGVLVGVVTADCVPVLLLAPRARAAAAVHAGWRGAAAGVVGAAVGQVCLDYGLAPDALEACLGPAIGACCYQVDVPVYTAFAAAAGGVGLQAFTTDGAQRWRFDPRGAVRTLLHAAGVTRVEQVGPCTACDRRYCSYRRDGGRAGRQLSFIGWA